MRQQPVIGHADAEAAGNDIQHEGSDHRADVDVEEGGDGADVKTGHRDDGDPVHPSLVLASVQLGLGGIR